MNVQRAFAAGMIGGAVSTILFAIARMLGIEAGREVGLGTMLGLAPGGGAFVLGLALFLVASGVFGLLYGLVFERVAHRSGALPGLAVSLAHMMLMGLWTGWILPAVHPMIPERMMGPGAFLSNLGAAGLALFVISHAAFGAIVGALYGPVRHPRRTTEIAGLDRRSGSY